jgi:hypothetical protein
VPGRFGRDYLRHNGPEHVLCFAPTRSGKGAEYVSVKPDDRFLHGPDLRDPGPGLPATDRHGSRVRLLACIRPCLDTPGRSFRC